MTSSLAQKRVFIVKLVNLLVVAVLVVCYAQWAQATSAADAAVLEQNQAAGRSGQGPYATDGTFTGEAQGYGGTITVQVTVESGYIQSVEVVSAPGEDSAYLSRATSLISNIVSEQTPSVDTVSGATYSSRGIINATTEALQKSMAGEGGAS